MMYTVKSNSEGLFKDKGSKFISYLYPVSNEDEVKVHLEELKAKHSKARHFCYAFRIGGKGDFERANDDGEPNGSAGLPMLNQLHSAKLTNALLVVVRYFGGTKLGLSGLIHAYKASAMEAIERNNKVVYLEKMHFAIEFPYSQLGSVERFLTTSSLDLIKKDFKDNCEFKLSCLKKDSEAIIKSLETIQKLKVIN